MMQFPNGETLRFRTRTRDPDGDWSAGDWADIPGVAVAPSSSTRTESDRSSQVSVYLDLYLPASAPEIPASAEIECRGKVWTVSSPEGSWQSPFTGWNPGRVLTITRSEG